MMQQEFEKLAGYRVTSEVYDAIEVLYLNSNLDKMQFAKKFKSAFKIYAVTKELPEIIVSSGKTLNGCWEMTNRYKVTGTDVKTGKRKVRLIPNSFEMRLYADAQSCEVIEVR